MPMELPSDLLIFSTPSSPSRRGIVRTTCGSSPYSRIRSRPNEEVEGLVGSAHLDVRLERHRVVPLRQRVEELVQPDRQAALVAFGEVVALEETRHGVLGSQLDEPGRPSLPSQRLLKSMTVFSGCRILKTCFL